MHRVLTSKKLEFFFKEKTLHRVHAEKQQSPNISAPLGFSGKEDNMVVVLVALLPSFLALLLQLLYCLAFGPWVTCKLLRVVVANVA